MTAIIRREIRRRVGAYSQGGGVYRRPVFISRAYSLSISTGVKVVPVGAGVVVVSGSDPLVGPLPGSGVVVIQGHSIGLLTDGQNSIVPGAGTVDVVGFRPAVFRPRVTVPLLRLVARRRDHAASYSERFPLPDYDVVIPHLYQQLPYRIVQIGAGEVVVEGADPGLTVDGSMLVLVGAGEVLVQGSAPESESMYAVAAGAGDIIVEGWQVKSSDLVNNPTPGAGDVVVLGYNPSVIAVGAYYRQDQQIGSWEAADTAVHSWSDVVVVTTVWTKQ